MIQQTRNLYNENMLKSQDFTITLEFILYVDYDFTSYSNSKINSLYFG